MTHYLLGVKRRPRRLIALRGPPSPHTALPSGGGLHRVTNWRTGWKQKRKYNSKFSVKAAPFKQKNAPIAQLHIILIDWTDFARNRCDGGIGRCCSLLLTWL